MIQIPPKVYDEAIESRFVESLREPSYFIPSLTRRVPGFEALPFRILAELNRQAQGLELKLSFSYITEGDKCCGELQILELPNKLQFQIKIRQRMFPVYNSQLVLQRFGLYTDTNQYITSIPAEIFDHNFWSSILGSRAEISFYSQQNRQLNNRPIYGRVRRHDKKDFWTIYKSDQTIRDVELLSEWKTVYGQNIFENDLCKCKIDQILYVGAIIVRSNIWYLITTNCQVFKIDSSFEFQEIYDSFEFDFESV